MELGVRQPSAVLELKKPIKKCPSLNFSGMRILPEAESASSRLQTEIDLAYHAGSAALWMIPPTSPGAPPARLVSGL